MNQHWIYNIVSLYPQLPTKRNVEAWLNKMDEAGWELVSYVDDNDCFYGVFRKPRPKV